MKYKKQPQESKVIYSFYSMNLNEKNLENSIIENFDYIARGKGGIKDKLFAYRTRLPYLNTLFRKEISKGHINTEQLEKLRGSLNHLEKRTKELKTIPLDEKECLIRYLRAYLGHEEWLLKEKDAQEEIKQRREQYLKKISTEKIGLKRKFLAAAFTMLLPCFCAENLNKDIRIPKIASKNDEIKITADEPCIGKTPIEGLIARLKADGIENPEKYFNNPRFEIYKDTVMLRKEDRNIDYLASSFGYVTRASYEQCIEYLKEHKETFDRIEKEFGIKDFRYAITSLLQLESNLGRKTGRRIVFNAYVSEYILNAEAGNTKRSEWFYSNLSYLLKHEKELLENIPSIEGDIFNLKGSWAGAFGDSQILATWFELCKDYDNDGLRNPFSSADAILLSAKKLIEGGYCKSEASLEASLKNYNPKSSYSSAIIFHSNKLKQLHKVN